MAAVESAMLPLGTSAPAFTLKDTVSGEDLSLSNLKAEVATVVMFICNHCPFVVHIQDELVALAHAYRTHGIQFIAISSNDVANYPDDSPEKMHDVALSKHYPFPYLYDETQAVAKAYDAQCTPDFFVFDTNLALVYRGQFDDSTPGNGKPVTGAALRSALDALLAGEQPSTDQQPSIGCNIKWRE